MPEFLPVNEVYVGMPVQWHSRTGTHYGVVREVNATEYIVSPLDLCEIKKMFPEESFVGEDDDPGSD